MGNQELLDFLDGQEVREQFMLERVIGNRLFRSIIISGREERVMNKNNAQTVN